MSGGPKGPLSPPQELEVGGRRPPYLLVKDTITAGAAGPLVLESGGSVFFVFLYFTTHQFVFQSNNFSISPQLLPQIFTTDFYHKFYHKLLPETTIIIGE